MLYMSKVYNICTNFSAVLSWR